MKAEIWYREELIVLMSLVEAGIRQASESDKAQLLALGHLHIKLEAAIKTSPSMATPEGKS